MRTFVTTCLIVLLNISGGYCQTDDIIWIDFMDDLKLTEGRPVGTKIATLKAVYNDGSSDNIVYGFNDIPAVTDSSITSQSDFLRIDRTTGEVFILSPLNYDGRLSEKYNGDVEDNLKSFVVNLIAVGIFNNDLAYKKVRTEITLDNLNDETPRFVNDSMRFAVVESRGDPGPIDPPILVAENIIVADADGFNDIPGQRIVPVTIQSCIIADVVAEAACPSWFQLEVVFMDAGVIRDAISPSNITISSNSRITVVNLYLNTSLDFEGYQSFQVQLLADDGKQKSNTDVVITVIDIQDKGPIWVILPPSSTTRDGTAPGEFQVSVTAVDQDSPEIRRPVSYKFKPGQTNEGIPIEEIFSIGPSTGTITNLVELDLEDTLYFKNQDRVLTEWNLILIACEIFANGTITTECTTEEPTTIVIEDRNDNPPAFNLDTYRYSIPEDVENGFNLNQPPILINDPDMEGFNIYMTVMTTPSEEFMLIGADSVPVIVVKNNSLIDYDLGPRQYRFTLRTYDVNNNLFEDFANVIIDITDVNDITPEFTLQEYLAIIPEDAPEGYFVTNVSAADIDTGLFGKQGIQYTLTGGGKAFFDINEDTGTITVAKCPFSPTVHGEQPCMDYDTPIKSYDFVLFATDNKNQRSGRRQGTASLRVQLTDVNDNPPTVGNYSASMFELTRVFLSDLIVQGTDLDTGTVLSYRVTSQSPGQFFKIDARTGEISLSAPSPANISYDDALDGKFNLIVEVSDNKYTALSYVTIEVIDINDKAPVLLPNNYRIEINEDTPENTRLLTVSATDSDDPTTLNGQLEYVIQSGNTGGRFELDIKTGVLYTAPGATFDYSVNRQFDLTVRVYDLGTPRQEAIGQVIVIILDLNNKNPQLVPRSQRYTMFENLPVGVEIGQLTGRDEDENSDLTFRFTDERGANTINGFSQDPSVFDFTNLFRITTDGRIFVNAPLNAELANIITYSAEVEDVAALEKQTGTGTVVFYVKPFNNRPPVFVDLPEDLVIKEELSSALVTTIVATDDNGILAYEIESQPHGFFAISPTSGVVQIISRIDYDDFRRLNSSYFVVIVKDRGDPQLTSTATVTVRFTNINDNKPQFLRNPDPDSQIVNLYTATIPENSPDNTPVVQVYTRDNDRPDENGFHIVRYYMNDDRFDVDEITGQVYVRLRNGAVLDREAGSRVLAQVIARDNPNRTNGEPQQQRVATISIILTDVNDNPPVFNQKEFFVAIFETFPLDPGTIIQLFINDADLGENAISYFTKIPNAGDDFSDLFDVYRDLGQVYVKKSLVGQVGTYNFFVQAQDRLGQDFITNVSVVVEVRPSANSPPTWVIPPMDNMTIFVLEEQYSGMLVLDVSARDLDTGDNGKVVYSFIYEGETTQTTPDFKVNWVTGVIQAEIIYDRERVDRYVLLLKATDQGETQLETTRFLTIVVKDVNDNVPTFPFNEVEFTVNEDVDVGYVVGTLEAVDIDLDPVIKYRIISGNEEDVFDINEDTGDLFLKKSLNREDKSIYYIQVQASNNEPDFTVIRSRRKRAIDPSIVTVKITVGDINDLAPVFLEDRYYGCISTRSQFGKHIQTVRAVDRDAIGTGIVRFALNKTDENGNTVGNDYFTIHPKFGIITNTVLMRTHADKTFDLTINARDGLDPADSESSNTNMKVFVTQPGKEVKILITQNTAEVRLYQSQIQSIIEQSSNIDYLCILDVQDHVVDSVGSTTTLWSDVYVSGVRVENDGTHTILSARELKNIIDFERTNRKNDFDLLYIKEVEVASSSSELDLDDKAVIIILIIIAVLIFLVIIFCIVAFMCIKAAKTQKKQRLVHKTNSPPPAPVIMIEHEPEPVPVIYDNRAYIPEPEPVIIQEQEVITPEPIHVQYAVVKKGSDTPVNYETEYYTSNTVDDEVIVVPLDDGYQQQVVQPAVYNAQQDEGDEYRIVTEVEQM